MGDVCFFPVEMQLLFFLTNLDTEVLRISPVKDQWPINGSNIPRESTIPEVQRAIGSQHLFDSTSAWFNSKSIKLDIVPSLKFNVAPENRQSQKETHLPTIIFQRLC